MHRARETVSDGGEPRRRVHIRSRVRARTGPLQTLSPCAKLTGGWPVLDVAGAMHHRIILTVPCWRAQRVPLLDTVETVRGRHVARRLKIADLHAADEASSRAHAESH